MKVLQTLEEKHRIAEEIAGVPITWQADGLKGYMLCPMADAHTKPTKDNHTICYLDGVPTFFCWHQSCKEWVETANTELREKVDERSPAERKADAEIRVGRAQAQAASDSFRRNLDQIIAEYRWDEIFAGPRWNLQESFAHFLSLWQPDDHIWIGEIWDTGVNEKKNNSFHFASVAEWKSRQVNRYANHFTTGSTFKQGSVDRIKSNIVETPYVVVEFDSLSPDPEANKRMGAALLNYLHKLAALDLVMVVDSGNKSVHGWFRNNFSEQEKFFLRQIGADPQSMRPSQPVRLPGAIRSNGRMQHLLWIA